MSTRTEEWLEREMEERTLSLSAWLGGGETGAGMRSGLVRPWVGLSAMRGAGEG